MGEQRTILVVDDAAIFRDLGAVFLARTGRVVTAADGREALAVARRERPAVVVADLEMPLLGGDELCAALKRDPELAETPVILVTSGESAEERARAVRSGADDVLAKPISRVTLIQAVNRFLRFPQVRGMARVPLDIGVEIGVKSRATSGRLRNLSRGGVFVETDGDLPAQAEVSLEFQLPETTRFLATTAVVVWRRDERSEKPRGVGLRFLAVDPRGAETLEDFVYERVAAQPDPEAPGSFITVR